MDLRLYLSVLWRFRLLVLAGVALAFLAAAAVVVRADFRDGRVYLTPREQETWQSGAILHVTQEGFPEGRTSLGETVTVGPDGESIVTGARFSDPARYTGLATIYAQLAKSDAVRRVVLARGRLSGTYEAEPLRASDGATSLPLVYIRGLAASPEHAVLIANRATTAFRAYLRTMQQRNGIPAAERVHVTVANRASTPTLMDGRSIVRPAAVFLLVLMAVLGVAFALENLRPRPVRLGSGPYVRVPEPETPNPERAQSDEHEDSRLRPAPVPTELHFERDDSRAFPPSRDESDASAGDARARG